jgi:predicted kinase
VQRGEGRPTGAKVIAVTGVPGAGKTTLSRGLAAELGVPFVSLDAVKEQLYATSAARLDGFELRRAAEEALAEILKTIVGPVVVDMWVQPGRDKDRVTDLLAESAWDVVEVLCRVPGEVATERYRRRARSGPHRPADAATLQRIHEAAEAPEFLGVDRRLEVDTSRPVNLQMLAQDVRTQ